MQGSLHVFPDLPALAIAGARFISDLLSRAMHQRGTATIVLSGGSTPRSIYERLGTTEGSDALDWSGVHFFWGDERCGPPDSPESNYHMANHAFLNRVGISESNIHRMMAERDPAEAALLYEQEIRSFFGITERQIPAFDVVLLGLGEDGHTASLFPGSPVLDERQKLVSTVTAGKFPTRRMTLTFPAINQARDIIFFVAGITKAEILRSVLEGSGTRYPAQLVAPAGGNLHWFADREAASLLSVGVQS